MRWRAVPLVLVAACYPGIDNSDCAIRCGAALACPSNLSCAAGFCVEDGQTCGDPTLVLSYSFEAFDPNNSDLLPDTSANGNNARQQGGPTIEAGVHGMGLTFDGDNEYLVTPHSPSLAVASGGAFTIEFWMLIAGTPPFANDQIVLAKVWNNDEVVQPFYEFGIEIDNATNGVELFLGDDQDIFHLAALVQPALGEFVHFAFTWDGTTVAAYLNGQAQDLPDPNLQITIPDRGQNLVIGAQAVPREFLDATLDDLRIYNRALAAAEIAVDMDTPVAP